MHYPKWTREEDELIRKYYPSMGAEGTTEQLRQMLHVRTSEAVRMRASYLNVRKNNPKAFNDSPWTEEELAILREAFPKRGAKGTKDELAKRGYSRTAGSISTRASMLGVRVKNHKRRMQKAGDTVIRNICLDSVLDREVIDKLDSVRNRSEYVRGLVRRDMSS